MVFSLTVILVFPREEKMIGCKVIETMALYISGGLLLYVIDKHFLSSHFILKCPFDMNVCVPS